MNLNTKHGHATKRQGMTPTYVSWHKMKQRCLNPNYNRYADYGGRGIGIYLPWLDFQNFLRDVGERPSMNHSLDRFPDKNGNYEPCNVRWATRSEQQNNRRANRLLTLGSETLTMTEWQRRLGFERGTIPNRLKAGWGVERALTTPLMPGRRKV